MEYFVANMTVFSRVFQKSKVQVLLFRSSSTAVKEHSAHTDVGDKLEASENKSDELESTEKKAVEPISEAELERKMFAKPLLQRDILNHKYKKSVFRQAQEVLYRYPPEKLDFDWSNKWPTQQPFNPYLVPLPIRMGYAQNKCVSPDKFRNLELMKVQNFLHLTPPAIEKHCKALKRFCTPFPSALKSDEACEKSFPIESHSVDYLAATNSVKNPLARTVTKKIRLSSLILNAHARRKVIQLLGEDRYDRNTDIATIKVERCPTRKQNSDFIDYVLTALYFESWTKEKWETREYMEDGDGQYWWEDSVSHKNLRNIFGDNDDELSKKPEVESYRKAVTAVKLEPKPTVLGEMTKEREKLIDDYKQSVVKLLNLNPLQ